MAQKTVVTVVCDLPHDGEAEGNETVSFAFDGASYEIDVCTAHAKDLHDTFAAYAERARRVMEELRRRLADPARPVDERDYLERLMKRD